HHRTARLATSACVRCLSHHVRRMMSSRQVNTTGSPPNASPRATTSHPRSGSHTLSAQSVNTAARTPWNAITCRPPDVSHQRASNACAATHATASTAATTSSTLPAENHSACRPPPERVVEKLREPVRLPPPAQPLGDRQGVPRLLPRQPHRVFGPPHGLVSSLACLIDVRQPLVVASRHEFASICRERISASNAAATCAPSVLASSAARISSACALRVSS